ncbi:hypothetical protein [Paracoccus aminovorans]|uniref:hypothetical protein n=1 Tax=Paracoccus aminovorans TaxID=34004 RepID=UPI002B260E22|nr:hypothetical protein [Paracoccus aminovorans]
MDMAEQLQTLMPCAGPRAQSAVAHTHHSAQMAARKAIVIVEAGGVIARIGRAQLGKGLRGAGLVDLRQGDGRTAGPGGLDKQIRNIHLKAGSRIIEKRLAGRGDGKRIAAAVDLKGASLRQSSIIFPFESANATGSARFDTNRAVALNRQLPGENIEIERADDKRAFIVRNSQRLASS